MAVSIGASDLRTPCVCGMGEMREVGAQPVHHLDPGTLGMGCLDRPSVIAIRVVDNSRDGPTGSPPHDCDRSYRAGSSKRWGRR